jgi:UDP-N-acetylglucosamine diphosphorylase/glucosamine-1-phosphate N-acetyltransferase
MQYLLFEDQSYFDLWPLTFTRPTCDLRIGIDKLHEKWSRFLGQAPSLMAYSYLQAHFSHFDPTVESIFLNGKFVPDAAYTSSLLAATAPNTFLQDTNGEILSFRCIPEQLGQFDGIVTVELLMQVGLKSITAPPHARPAIRFPWDIFRLNGQCIREDFEHVIGNRVSEKPEDRHSIVYGADNLFLAPGVKMRAAVINAEDGPIYIGEGVDIQEGSLIHGAHAFCDHVTLNMGVKLRGDTTVGPWSKVGGEIANSVIQGYSNKGHDGYLGNSVLGYWCNLGADSNTSNLKNNYTEVRVWNYRQERFARTGTIFCGLIMGDHSKCGINTMFNTGTVVGVSANVFGAGYPRNFIPSFSWGGAAGLSTFTLPKAFEVAEAVMGRRKMIVEDAEKAILTEVFQRTEKYRNWEREVKSEK